MAPRTKEQFEEIRQDRKLLIMNSAMELFANEGYAHVSIAALAKHAGISKGLMYNYFDSKEQLLREILNKGIDEIMLYFDPDHDGILTPEEFELFIRKTFQIMRENQDFWLKLFRLIVQPNIFDLLKDSALLTFTEKYFTMFEAYFRKQGFEDPMLEVLYLSVIIEGMGAMMMYSNGLTDLPQDLYTKLEERIIKTYT